MKKGTARLAKLLLAMMISAVIPCMLLNYIVDPLQFYRKSFYFNNSLYIYQRYQNPGLARNYDYDSVIIGTSMTENFLPSDVDGILGTHILKLSISAASAYEQNKMLGVAIETGKVETVLWGIDFSSFKGSYDRKGSDDSAFPGYMYDNGLFNDLRYLLNDKTTELSITALIKLIRLGPARKYLDVSRYSFWYPYVVFGEKEMREKGEIFKETYKGMGAEYDISEIKESVSYNLIRVIEENPGINFYLFYTPASVLREHFFISEGIFEAELEFKMFINSRLSGLENVSIYDFQAAPEIVLDYERYSDYSHYDLTTMRYMLECMKTGKYRVTEGNDLIEDFKALVIDNMEQDFKN